MPEIHTVRDLRRAQILDAAAAIVAEGGLEALTFAALEERLEFTRGVITYHFRNKEEIVETTLLRAVAEIDAATAVRLRDADSAGDKAAVAIRSTIEGFMNRVEAARILISFWSRIPVDPHIAGINARLYALWREEMARLLVDEIGAEHARSVAGVAVGLVIGIATQHYFEPGSVDVEALIAEAEAMVRARLREE